MNDSLVNIKDSNYSSGEENNEKYSETKKSFDIITNQDNVSEKFSPDFKIKRRSKELI